MSAPFHIFGGFSDGFQSFFGVLLGVYDIAVTRGSLYSGPYDHSKRLAVWRELFAGPDAFDIPLT